ncbi:MAG: hypothetical protein NTV55_12835 [Planctomycetota bacterium]|nr:hypothetical protein [Planctomycetota bacterium]
MNMKSIGGYLFFFGMGSMVLNYLGYEFMLLNWIDWWGPENGWAIRIGMAVVGGAMWLLAYLGEQPAKAAAEGAETSEENQDGQGSDNEGRKAGQENSPQR